MLKTTTVMVGAALALATAAAAQDTVISAEPFVDTLLPFVATVTSALIAVLVPLIFAYVLKKWGLDVDKEHRDAFQTSVTNAAGLLLQKAASGASTAKIDVGSPMMAEAIRYVQERAPDALKKWGITPDMIAKTIVAKIPQIEASSGAAPMSTNTVRAHWGVTALALITLGVMAACSTVTGFTGITAEQQICAAAEFAAQEDRPESAELTYRQKAAAVATACEIDLNVLLAGQPDEA